MFLTSRFLRLTQLRFASLSVRDIASPAEVRLSAHFEEEGDRREREFLENPRQRESPGRYAARIKSHLSRNEIDAAVTVVTKDMRHDKAPASSYLYNLVLGGCAKNGRVKQAFHLFAEMRRCGLKPTGGTYTALFDACSRGGHEDGLRRAHRLRSQMRARGDDINATHYHAMMKAFGRCGDLTTAFSLADEMLAREIPLTADTLNHLLMACASDSKTGFRLALDVWRRFSGCGADRRGYHLLLRVARDCGIGNDDVKLVGPWGHSLPELMPETMSESMERLGPGHEESSEAERYVKEDDVAADIKAKHAYGFEVVTDLERARMTAERVHKLGNKSIETPVEGVSESQVTVVDGQNQLAVQKDERRLSASDKLLALGGATSFLLEMRKAGVHPDVKTFTHMLQLIPDTLDAEKSLSLAMRESSVSPDVPWYNLLLTRRSIRGDREAAAAALAEMARRHLAPDEMTFGALALGCETKEQAAELLTGLQAAGIRPNVQILGALAKQACCRYSFGYVLAVMETLLAAEITPNRQFYGHLHTFHTKCRQMIFDKKMGRPGSKFVESGYFRDGFRRFQMRYKTWLDDVQVPVDTRELPEEEPGGVEKTT